MRVCPAKYANTPPSAPADIVSSSAGSSITYSARVQTGADGLPPIPHPGETRAVHAAPIAQRGPVCADELSFTRYSSSFESAAKPYQV